jgi:hypothetical protein
MSKTIPNPAEICAGDKSSPARKIPAVALCCDAWDTAFQVSYARDKMEHFARKSSNKAYRDAMPPLSGYQSICDFIACVAHGLAIGAIEDATASRLLYAARAAHSILRNQPKTKPQAGPPPAM